MKLRNRMAPKGLKSFQGMALAQELLAELEKNLASHQGSRSLALALSGTPPPAASSKAPVPGKQATMARQWASLGAAIELRQNTSGRPAPDFCILPGGFLGFWVERPKL